MRNLYIANTPLHLLTAYIMANYYTAGQENCLAILNPKNFSLWSDSYCLAKMYSDETTWDNVIIGTQDYLKTSVKKDGVVRCLNDLHRKINAGGVIDQVYLAQDKMLVNQIVAEMTGNTTYIRFDEGTASYIVADKRKWQSKVGEYLAVQTVRRIAGLHSDMKYNYNGLGCGQVATADYLFKPHLLKRVSPNPIAIDKKAIAEALEKIIPDMNDYNELRTGKIIIYLGSKLSDNGMVDREAELKVLRNLSAMADNLDCKLLYKPHPGERQEKLNDYAEKFPSMKFFRSVEPMEIVLYKYSNIKALVTGVHTSVMLYADIFAQQEIKLISAAYFLGYSLLGQFGYLMENAGMQTPKDYEEMEQMLRTI